ncbi:hypothetical protein L4D06_09230 [Enterovibrio makurazakiensis]|uniref:hypothetical protein n=1 Tax=Enterovibrio makurazakiensis TaxID=2910232 RepID=UPI003D1A1CDF
MFYTKTSISILEADTAPAGVSIGYERDEGFIGPRYENGAVPPVIASIETNANIINPSVSELYATGKAAIAATTDNYTSSNAPLLTGEKKLMFFGTSTSLGLAVNTLNNLPSSFVFGYRRKTLSYIPLGSKKNENGISVDTYPSVFASIETNIKSFDKNGSISKATPKLNNKQYIATGKSAENIANALKNKFIERAKVTLSQSDLASSLLACYMGIPDNQKIRVWKSADQLDLYNEEKNKKGSAIKILEGFHADGDIDNADMFYASLIIVNLEYDNLDENGNVTHSAKKRTKNLEKHKDAVCILSMPPE